MKDYELSVLLHPDLEMNADPTIGKVKKIVTQAGGKFITEDNQGKKRLAYPIKGHTFALYYYADVQLPSDAPDKISTAMNISDEVIRYLLVRTDARKAKYAALRAEAEASEASEIKDDEESSDAHDESSDDAATDQGSTDTTNKEDK